MEEYVRAIRGDEIVVVPRSVAIAEELFVLGTHKTEETKALPKLPETGKRNVPVYRLDYKKNNVVKELIDNFHWEILKYRREKNLSRKQLANALRVPEEELKMVERGELPRDDFILISKIESHIGVNLRKNPSVRSQPSSLADLQKRKEQQGGKPESKMTGSDLEIFE